jgi:hypothetical protein
MGASGRSVDADADAGDDDDDDAWRREGRCWTTSRARMHAARAWAMVERVARRLVDASMTRRGVRGWEKARGGEKARRRRDAAENEW